jgi:hypothetical protein
MTAQPLDSHDGFTRVHLPRTIKSIRSALPADKRAQFAAELDDSEAGGLAIVVERWWMRAVVWSSPSTMAKLDAYDAGERHGLPIAEVLGDHWAA